MQTPKTSTKSSSGSEGVRRISPRSVSSDTPQWSSGRVVRQLKTTGLEPISCRTPKITSPKIIERTSSRAPVPELQKKRLGRVVELEAQVTQLEDALRTVKDQLILSESWKKQAKIDAEESRKELSAMSLKLEESQKLLGRSSSEEVHDSAALAAARLEIDQLKVKLDTISESEATQTKQSESAYAEIQFLKDNMAEMLSLMEEMKGQLEDCKSSESQAQALASETLLQLETAKKTMESLKFTSDEYKYKAILLELDESRARVRSLEGIINKMKTADQESESEEIVALKSELGKLKSADIRFHEEQCRRTLDISGELKKSKADIEELKANLIDKETELQCILEENEDLNARLANMILGTQENESKQDFNSLKSDLTKLETELCETLDENEKLKLEIMKLKGAMEVSKQDFNSLKSKLMSLETELCEKTDENEKLKLEFKKMNGVIEASKQEFNSLKPKLTNLETELCERSDENEKLKLEIKKMEGVTEAIKKSNNEVAQVTERLEGTEEELRRLKVQMGQWRKAAEAATAMLCDENSDNNGRMLVERTWSMDHCSPRMRMNIGSPCSVDIDDDDDDDEFLKRKHGNMLKRIGVLWKKPQNK